MLSFPTLHGPQPSITLSLPHSVPIFILCMCVQTSHQHVHIYAIYSWKEPMAPGSSPLLTRDVPRVDVYLRGSVQVTGMKLVSDALSNLSLIISGAAPGRQQQRGGRRGGSGLRSWSRRHRRRV